MKIAEILDRLPSTETQLFDATTPQIFSDPYRRRLLEARPLLERLYRETKRIELLDVADLLPHDPCHFEQVIATAEGQEAIRAQITHARELLKILGTTGGVIC
jgi:hypothetical protein